MDPRPASSAWVQPPPLSLPVRAQSSTCPLRGRANTGRPGGPTLRTWLQPLALWELPYLEESVLCLSQEAPDPVLGGLRMSCLL